ncbi:hypothetical protein HYPSUDRAFT_909414 [Hypholoma sublateritium FD-334 SS-4]|uniref:Uncharacterized protein n=1 Tax=Hypholoma sublateritium (strain FD-334 SS-4) TaxID=945553 RepID=A0A0D2KWN0_HYPSF|nr:hypothetical protein HYPSUDRAFT_909414 [Hypholoma sublateritium FD-334 SS-4]
MTARTLRAPLDETDSASYRLDELENTSFVRDFSLAVVLLGPSALSWDPARYHANAYDVGQCRPGENQPGGDGKRRGWTRLRWLGKQERHASVVAIRCSRICMRWAPRSEPSTSGGICGLAGAKWWNFRGRCSWWSPYHTFMTFCTFMSTLGYFRRTLSQISTQCRTGTYDFWGGMDHFGVLRVSNATVPYRRTRPVPVPRGKMRSPNRMSSGDPAWNQLNVRFARMRFRNAAFMRHHAICCRESAIAAWNHQAGPALSAHARCVEIEDGGVP